MDRLLTLMVDRGASDLHLVAGKAPILRLSGQMEPQRSRVLSNRDFVEHVRAIAPARLWERYMLTGDVDFAYEVPDLARFRVNLFMQEHGFGAVFRIIPSKIMTVDQLGLPSQVGRATRLEGGLFLVTGPTGSGKSTTLAAVIDRINSERKLHIVTIEDPIEFVHPNKRSIISQREVGAHAQDFSSALKAAVREDPNVILVGEMRDRETISLALAAASTGLLVFGTLHTNSAAKTCDRIVNVFPTEEQDGVRSVLAETLQGIAAQQLVRKKGGGRVAAVELLFRTPSLPTLIREGKTHQLTGLIQMGRRQGMIAMDDSLAALVQAGTISFEDAYEKAIDKASFRALLGGVPEAPAAMV
ncbi:type IV pilus twitching motility protein PilT [Myxococcota bacterium]|nr:type IV pilus twitching motility protein PilT [Myxococcota bacterium]